MLEEETSSEQNQLRNVDAYEISLRIEERMKRNISKQSHTQINYYNIEKELSIQELHCPFGKQVHGSQRGKKTLQLDHHHVDVAVERPFKSHYHLAITTIL